jgi:hypothetical protein
LLVWIIVPVSNDFLGGLTLDAAITAEAPVHATCPGSKEPGAAAFVWGGWAFLTALALTFVARYAPNLPVGDDFDVVEVAVGGHPMTLEWLWSLHNEHRVPLPRLILLSLYRISNNDFRAGMFLSVAALATLSAASIVIAARRPGGCRTYDVLFPLLLLNPSHATNLLWSWQLQLVASTVIAGAVILIMVSRAAWPGPGAALSVGICLAALALCGANGVALVPALAGWLVAASVAHWNSGLPRGRLTALLVLMTAAPGIALTVLYFAGYQSPAHHASAGATSPVLRASVHFMSLMFGTKAPDLWPTSGFAAVTAIASSVLLLARVLAIGPAPEKPRAIGLLCAFAAMASLALGIGWGRGALSEHSVFEPRYVTLTSPIWLAVIFTWDAYASPAVRRVVLTSLLSATLILLWPSTKDAIDTGRALAERGDQFYRDVRAGTPLYQLVKRHASFMFPSHDVLTKELSLLRKARVGVFARIQPDPDFREHALPVKPATSSMVRWKNATATVTGVDAYLQYKLPTALNVAGIRLKYSHTNALGSAARFRMWWTSTEGIQAAPDQSYSNWALPTGRDQITTIWIVDTVKEFRLQPDNQRCEFTVNEITVLYR